MADSAPLWVGLASMLLFKEKLTRNYWIGLAIAMGWQWSWWPAAPCASAPTICLGYHWRQEPVFVMQGIF
jgi:drug/metabolite transporter (DMT)-like permease